MNKNDIKLVLFMILLILIFFLIKNINDDKEHILKLKIS